MTNLCVIGDFASDVLIRTNTELLKGGDTFGEIDHIGARPAPDARLHRLLAESMPA